MYYAQFCIEQIHVLLETEFFLKTFHNLLILTRDSYDILDIFNM